MGSRFACEGVGTFSMTLADRPLSRASSLPQGFCARTSELRTTASQCGSEPARESAGTFNEDAGGLHRHLQQHLIRPTALLLDHQMDEMQFGDHRSRHDERVEIRLAHAARQLVEHARQFDPGVDE